MDQLVTQRAQNIRKQVFKSESHVEPRCNKTNPILHIMLTIFRHRRLSASRWLKKLQSDLKLVAQLGDPSYPREYVNTLDVLLIGEAAEWAEENPLVQARIIKTAVKLDDVYILKQFFRDRFLGKIVESSTFNINSELESLRQQDNESLLV